ncbi:MAG: site-specific integrase [Rhodospirillales bacterium]|nr:site-specific integrase [Rhodospirillales bacterium]
MPKLTKSFVDKLVPPAKGDAFHWDTDLKGFGLRANAAGKSFVVQGRIGSGRSAPAARLTIGPYGVFTPDQARDAAREHLRNMRMGVDPRAAAKASIVQRRTLREVADDYMRDIPLKDTSKRAIRQAVGATFKEIGWADKPLASITRAMVDESFLEMRERAPGHANHAFGILRAVFNYATRQYTNDDKTPIFTDNPVKVLHRKWAKLRPRTGRIPDEQLSAVWNHLQNARETAHNGHTRSSIDLVTFLLLTGARMSEATKLTWDRVDFEKGTWHLPDLKNGNKVWLPLSSQAIELLHSRQKLGINSPYVFPSWEGHIKDPRDAMKNLSAVAGRKLTPHDLRRSFTHVGAWLCQIDIQRVELLTNHLPTSVTARHYLETEHLEYLKPEVQRIADRIVGGAA